MARYKVCAVHELKRGQIEDVYILEADSFEDACQLAQELELGEAEQTEREGLRYDYYTQGVVYDEE